VTDPTLVGFARRLNTSNALTTHATGPTSNDVIASDDANRKFMSRVVLNTLPADDVTGT